MNNTVKIVIFLCILTLVLNYGLHAGIVNESKKIRESAYEYVYKNCKLKTNNAPIIDQEIRINETIWMNPNP